MEPIQDPQQTTDLSSCATTSGQIDANGGEQKKALEPEDKAKYDEISRQRKAERKTIKKELKGGLHLLILEHNDIITCMCHAQNCVVKGLPLNPDPRIGGRFKVNLRARFDETNKRFYHISCLESIDVDMTQFLTLPPEHYAMKTPEGPKVVSRTFHPAIRDWLSYKGQAFDAADYSDHEKALEEYHAEVVLRLELHELFCDNTCICDPRPDRPESLFFTQGLPTERPLSDIVVHIAGAVGDLAPRSAEHRIALVEGLALPHLPWPTPIPSYKLATPPLF